MRVIPSKITPSPSGWGLCHNSMSIEDLTMFENLLGLLSSRAVNPIEPLPTPTDEILGYQKAMMMNDAGTAFYSFGGNTKTNTATRKCWRYDIAPGTWTQLADIPADVVTAGYGNMVQIGDLIYYFNRTKIMTYAISTGTWALKLTLPSNSPMAMYGSGVYLYNGLIYSVRYSEGNYPAGMQLVEYNPTTNSLRAINKVTSALNAYVGGGVVNGKLYMTTGTRRTPGMLSYVDLNTFVWTDIPSAFNFDFVSGSVVHDNKIYMFADQQVIPTSYDPATNQYVGLERLKTGFSQPHQVVAANGIAYVLTNTEFFKYQLE